MRPLLLSTSDIAGGAARAAYRLHLGLLECGVDSRMLVQQRLSAHATVTGPRGRWEKVRAKAAPHLDRVPLEVRRVQPRAAWSNQWLENPVAANAGRAGADLLHLHWVSGGFVPIRFPWGRELPTVWTLHDMWPFTGGCHYDQECGRYRGSCGRCPLLDSERERDYSRVTWKRKARAWADREMTIVAPSRWLAECARGSSLMRERRVEVIPNGLQLDRYRPIPKSQARQLLGLPLDRRLIAFGAVASTSDPRKGYDLLVPALRRLSAASTVPTGVLVFGASAPERPDEFGMPSWFLGELSDDVSLALVYSAADAFAAPSRQDNLPNTVLEALACGTPSVAFDVGGFPDLIGHMEDGFLARPFDVDDLARGLQLLVESSELREEWGRRARAKAVAQFSLSLQASRYIELYSELLGGGRR